MFVLAGRARDLKQSRAPLVFESTGAELRVRGGSGNALVPSARDSEEINFFAARGCFGINVFRDI